MWRLGCGGERWGPSPVCTGVQTMDCTWRVTGESAPPSGKGSLCSVCPFIFWVHLVSYGVLVPWPRMETWLLAVKGHWSTREFWDPLSFPVCAAGCMRVGWTGRDMGSPVKWGSSTGTCTALKAICPLIIDLSWEVKSWDVSRKWKLGEDCTVFPWGRGCSVKADKCIDLWQAWWATWAVWLVGNSQITSIHDDLCLHGVGFRGPRTQSPTPEEVPGKLYNLGEGQVPYLRGECGECGWAWPQPL